MIDTHDVEFEIRSIPIDHLFVDSSYHQRFNVRTVENIREHMDSTLVGFLYVNLRPDYVPPPDPRWWMRLYNRMPWRKHPWYSIIDGVARYEAMKRSGAFGVIPCCVITVPRPKESELFMRMNQSRRSAR